MAFIQKKNNMWEESENTSPLEGTPSPFVITNTNQLLKTQ
jgi:hypothetical protein